MSTFITFQGQPKALILRQIARSVALAVILIGVVVLVGWTVGSQTLIRVWPGRVVIRANTALCFILSGFSLLGIAPSVPKVDG
jgi:hypothetical protein